MGAFNVNERPILVFWESTRACLLACKHCRAQAIAQPMPGELSTEEGYRFIESLTSFGKPYPVLIVTGGDALMREDVFALIAKARSLDIPVGVAPSVTPRLTDEAIVQMKNLGVKVISLSLDGATAQTHEGVRGIEGHFSDTIDAMQRLVDAGFEVQINTAVMRDNVHELPRIAHLLKTNGVHIWEVFFLIHVGRGIDSQEISPIECEDVSHFLFDVSTYGMTVRTVEAPFFRRVVAERKLHDPQRTMTLPEQIAEIFHLSPLYQKLSNELTMLLGASTTASKAQTSGTRDGKGIIFVSYDGTVYPAGFLPLPLGNIREESLSTIYRNHPTLQAIRSGTFSGKCGVCDYVDACGGSRSRAFSDSGDPLAEDPACSYVPTQLHVK
ncbi:TIGR04053 family radical SAM/SPASM domain-containing protein [Sulfoacidibacillus ferrooxidans]|uniref:Mycofactocin radical SAM maturase MftC n=1 Tax=Sulfoacidibacillus ferrooxidans TaxID=2005001 RepID=A0A9X1VE57_9BACL|nr:TIGR04053 family radical SAM/SPASM domain-containing protein [Sulfoacidibacillus ferrooxidans]MCI0184498.1 putative mycofactocin radical SAM maturase MftC [Sulfoacidibacillus ferrooxidans]